MKPDFSQQIFEKSTQTSRLIKIRPVGAALFHADGQTDMTKLIVAFRNIANAPENSWHSWGDSSISTPTPPQNKKKITLY